MNFKTIVPGDSISLFVKDILLFENQDQSKETILPFFADGYPGIMFQETSGLFVMPHNKQMPDLFLYGQTIRPIQLKIEGAYNLIVFQLYPFVLDSFFAVNPKDLNDDCYDLAHIKDFDVKRTISQLKKAVDFNSRINIITSLLYSIFQAKREKIDYKIQQAIQLIVNNRAQQTIKEVREKLNITERTFERRFMAQVGVTPKQFSKIIQFQLSLNDLTDRDFTKLTDIVYKNGYADQSHFIRVFKAFTGKRPKDFHIKKR